MYTATSTTTGNSTSVHDAKTAFAVAPNLRFSRSTTRRLPTHRRFIPVHAALSSNIARAAAAVTTAATLSLANIVRPASAASVELTPSATGLTVVRTLHDKRLPSTTMQAVVIGVGKSPIHDYEYHQKDTQAHNQAQKSTQGVSRAHLNGRYVSKESFIGSREQEGEEARREFLLAARLVTAVMMGVMLGVERRAMALNLGVRSLTVISVTAALAAVVSTHCAVSINNPAADFSRSILSTLNPSVRRHAVANALVPASATIVLAVATIAAVLCVSRAVVRRRSSSSDNKNKQNVECDNTAVLPSMSAAVGIAVGMGVACGIGLGLLAAGFYLAGVAVMRGGDHSLESRHENLDAVSRRPHFLTHRPRQVEASVRQNPPHIDSSL